MDLLNILVLLNNVIESLARILQSEVQHTDSIFRLEAALEAGYG